MIAAVALGFVIAAAPVSRRVVLTASGCDATFVTEVRNLLGIELKATVGALLSDASERVSLDCSATGVTAEVERDGKTMPVVIDVSMVDDDSRARTVALMLAEGMSGPIVPAPVEKKTPPPEPVPVPDQQRESRFSLSGFFAIRSAERVQLGGALSGELALLSWLGLHVDIVGVTATMTREGGTVQSTALDAAFGIDVRWVFGPLLIRIGPSARAGVAILTGRPGAERTGGTVAGGMWAPQISGGAQVMFDRFLISAFVDGGWWVPRLRGTVFNEAAVELSGAFVVAGVGAGWRL